VKKEKKAKQPALYEVQKGSQNTQCGSKNKFLFQKNKVPKMFWGAKLLVGGLGVCSASGVCRKKRNGAKKGLAAP